MDITCVVTTVGYVPNLIKWGLYTSALSYLVGDSRVSTSAVTTIILKGQPQEIATKFSIGSASTFTPELKEVLPLTLLNPSTPPPGPSPPPPIFGAISGSVSKDGNDFSFKVNIVGFTPTGVNCAFLTADGVPLRVVGKAYESTPMTWTIMLESSEIALASYAQVVAYKLGGGTSDALTLNW